MKIKPISRAYRIFCETPETEGYHVLIIPGWIKCGVDPNEDYREFYAVKEESGDMQFMFGCAVTNSEHAVELAVANLPDYIDM